MKLSDSVAPQLPYLRRYARALTGSQPSGDAYVVALLEGLAADPGILAGCPSPRIALYRALSAMWGSIAVNRDSGSSGDRFEATVQERLSSLPGVARQVYLLKSVEGFDIHQIGEIIGRTADAVARLYDEATIQISEMISSDVLIIEDEPLIALDIEDLVTSLGHRPIGIARTHREAIRIASERRPQIILSDIQLADGSSGIDAVNELLSQFDVPVIFITAYPERLLTGERPEPAFLITKPFSPDMVKGVIAQALFFQPTSQKAA